MKSITKSISYGSNSVQLFIEEELKSDSKIFIVLITNYGEDGEVFNMAEYRYEDYLKAVYHFHNIVINFFYPDLFQK